MAKRFRICRKIKGHKKRKCYFVKRNKKGRITAVTNIGRSTRIDSRKYVGPGRIPRTRGGKLRSGYGFMADYKRRKR